MAKIYKKTEGATSPRCPSARACRGVSAHARARTTSSSSAAARRGSRRPAQRPAAGLAVDARRRARHARRADLQAAGPRLRGARPRALGRDYLRGRALIDAVERSGARAAAAHERRRDRRRRASCSARRASARAPSRRGASCSRRAPTTGRSCSPAGRCPACSRPAARRRSSRRSGSCPGERIVFAGSGPLALAFPAQLHHYGANVALVLEAGPPPGPRDVARHGRRGPGNIDAAARRGALPRRAAARPRCRCATAASSSRAEGRRARRGGRARRASTATGASSPAARSGSRPTRSASATASSPRSSCCGSRAATLGYDEDLGGPVAVRRRVDAHERARASSRPATAPASPGSYVADRPRAASPRSARRSTSARSRPTQADARAAPIRAAAARASARSAGRCAPHARASGPGIYELADAGHRRLPLRGGHAARSSTGRSRRPPTSTSSRASRARDGPVPGPQLPAPDRGDDRARATAVRSPSIAVRDRRACPCARCRSARSPTPRSRTTGSSRRCRPTAHARARPGRPPSSRRPLPAETDVARHRRRPGRRRARLLPRRRGRRGRRSRARRAQPRGVGHERRQLPLPDRDPPADRRSTPARSRDRLLAEVRLLRRGRRAVGTLEARARRRRSTCTSPAA